MSFNEIISSFGIFSITTPQVLMLCVGLLLLYLAISKKFEPFLSIEIFHPANSNNNELNEYRFSLGTNLDLPRKKSLKLYYQYKVEDSNKKNPDENHIIGLSLGLN